MAGHTLLAACLLAVRLPLGIGAAGPLAVGAWRQSLFILVEDKILCDYYYF